VIGIILADANDLAPWNDGSQQSDLIDSMSRLERMDAGVERVACDRTDCDIIFKDAELRFSIVTFL
jgi:hypothetical protein